MRRYVAAFLIITMKSCCKESIALHVAVELMAGIFEYSLTVEQNAGRNGIAL